MSKNINPIDQVTQIDQETDASISRGQALIRQFVAYDYEHEVGKKVAIAKKNIASQSVASSSGEQSSNVDVVDCDKVYVQDSSVSVGSIIKTEAYNFRSQYHSLSTHKKAIVSLGLNSIIDLSFAFPGSQSILMKSQQWSELRKKFKPKAYDVADYMYIKEVLQPVVKIYQGKHTVHVNWLNMYKKIKALESQYDPELNPSNKDVSFCLYLLLQVLLIIKHQPNIFNDQIDNSEWDFVVKFWGLITERLFYFTHLRLKW
jgi:hypothetical protein